MERKKDKLALIIGNRDFFPDHLVDEVRRSVLEILGNRGIEAILPGPEETKGGGVETYRDARICADLFNRRREEIMGILVVLPNFGDEKGVADAIRLAGLEVPVLIQAEPDDPERLTPENRRDSYCGKISLCNNLRQYAIPLSLTDSHVTPLKGEAFNRDLERFLGVCRVTASLKRVRVGAVGARPSAFNTVRYSEKILESRGISVSTLDLSEVMAGMKSLDKSTVQREKDSILGYADCSGIDDGKIAVMARLKAFLEKWTGDNGLDALAFQCWTSLQENLGINPCTVMSMFSQKGIPAACEVDVTGALTMFALQAASGSPAALFDWNNNYGRERDKCVLFHCGNWPLSLLGDRAAVCHAPILGSTVGVENTAGALEGRSGAGEMTFGRITTDDLTGTIRTYVGDGWLTDDPLDTFGSRAVARIPRLEALMAHICRNGFEHHGVMTMSRRARILEEAFTAYLGWECYRHGDGVTD